MTPPEFRSFASSTFCAGLLVLVKAQHLGNLCFEIYRVVTACGCTTCEYVKEYGRVIVVVNIYTNV